MWRSVILVIAGCSLISTARGQLLPQHFENEIVLTGLVQPTNLEFAPDGRVFVAEKSGIIKVFDDLNDPTPTVFADLSENVHDFWDRGLLGLAIHPEFPSEPYVYVLYTLDAPPGVTPPVYGDACGDPTGNGCVVGARLSRLTADGDVMIGPEEIFIEGWCQQYPSHSIGDLEFGLDGALYVSAGDGASFNFPDFGQGGNPPNPCGDPPGEGGALRSQDLETSGDAVGLNGTMLRLDPTDGTALPDNPLFGGAVADDDRVIAYGLRNPFRFTVHPELGELWIGDVGWFRYEEINRVVDPVDSVVENFGWPCYESPGIQPEYDILDLPICENLYNSGTATPPVFAYFHSSPVVPGACGPTGSSVAGLAFYEGGDYPPEYNSALFFCDHNRRCIFVMFPGLDGLPNPDDRRWFAVGSGFVVDLEIGPGGDLHYVDISTGQVRRIRYDAPLFIRGDVNLDGVVNLGDPIANLEYLLEDIAPSLCRDAHDTNDDGDVDIGDPIYGLTYLFSMGPPPPPPFGMAPGDCGPDETADVGEDMDCDGPVDVCP